MSASTLVLVRHGESASNVAKTLDTNLPGPGLTPEGKEQVRQLAARFDAADITTVFSSIARRAIETATILGSQLELPTRALPDLHEVSAGDLAGSADPADWRTYETILTSWFRGDTAVRIPGGESGDEVLSRVRTGLDTILAKNQSGTSLVVVHGGMMRLLARDLDPRIDPTFAATTKVPNASTIVLDRQASNAPWSCRSWVNIEPPVSATASPQHQPSVL
jgi:probable phosphoglycerate mutase